MNSGIYKIQGSTNRFYLGSAKDFDDRWNEHLFYLKRGKHDNSQLQKVYNRGDELTFTILEFCEIDQLLSREQWWLDYWWDSNLLYNLSRYAGRPSGMKGMKHSEETKQKMRVSRTDRSQSEETKQKLRDINVGKIISEKTRQKLRDSRIGKRLSDETKQRLSESIRKNWERRRNGKRI